MREWENDTYGISCARTSLGPGYVMSLSQAMNDVLIETN